MSQRQRQRRETTAAGQGTSTPLLRKLVPLLLGLGALAIAANVYFWSQRVQLEPLPAVSVDTLPPRAQRLVERAREQVESNQRVPEAWGRLGAILRAHELGAEAEVCFRNAQRLDKTDYRWPYLLGVSLATTDAERALSCFRQAAQRCDNKPHVQLRLAEMLIERQLYDEAAELVEQSLRHDPENPRAQLAQARLLYAEGKLDEARSWAEKSAAGAADRRAPHVLLAQLCRRAGDEAAAAHELAILAEIPDGITPWEDPDVADVLALLQEAETSALDVAKQYVHERNFAAAAAALRKALKNSPTDERLHFELGIVCFQQQQFEEAAGAFRDAIELKADHVDAYYNLGHTLLKLGQQQQARDAFAAAVRLRPSHAFARINLADLLLQSDETSAAREHLEIAVRLAPQEQRAQDLLQRCNQSSVNDDKQ